MEDSCQISRDKVICEFDRRAGYHGNINAVLDAGDKPEIRRQNSLRDFLTRKRLMSLLNPLQSDAVLDFGCGMGRLTWHLQSRVSYICGLDPSEAMIKLAIRQAKPENNIQFTWLQKESLPYNNNTFSKAFTVWVLQHIEDKELGRIAAELFRVIKPGGKLVLLEQTRSKRKILSDIHIHRSPQEYIDIFQLAGFTVTRNRPAMRIPSYAMSVWNKFPSLSGHFLPLLYILEKISIRFRPAQIDYYTWAFIFEKNNV